ncbi:hypothetical protein MIMGU_mgv1a026873mg, partial [Erythranthe guttata]
AVLVGCLYPNYPEPYQLNGCINDVKMMKKMLIGRFGFDPKAIMVLTDKPGSKKLRATGKNIKIQLGNMIAKALPGDRLFFFFSGHGTSFTDKHNRNLTRHAIVACDDNNITCMDFRHYVNHLPKNATLTIIADSCFSGGLIDQEPVQVGLLPYYNPRINNEDSNYKPRKLPYEAYLAQLSSRTGLNSPDIGVHLVQLFDLEASILFSLPPDEHPKPLKADQGILLSGGEPNENTVDDPEDSNGPAGGAFTKTVAAIVNAHSAPITNKQLVIRARGILGNRKDHPQHPCLYCSNKNADAVFLRKASHGQAEIGQTSEEGHVLEE